MKSFQTYILTASLLLALVITALGQELNCTVTLNYNQLFSQQNTDNANLNQLKNVISDFINARRWTNDNFSPEERINFKLNINLIRSPKQGDYEGTAQLIVTRPVYGTNYETVVLNYVDRFFNFSYLPSNPMYFTENTYSDELTHMLAFYSYIVLALDYDSFSKLGGNPYVQRAFQLVNIAQNNSGASSTWRSSSDLRSRFWLIDNLMNQQILPFREAIYTYHRLGLDTFVENPIAARQQIMNVLNSIQQVSRLMPTSVLINSFLDAKGEEIYKIMNEASKDEKQKTFTVLSQIDPAKTEMYRKLLQ